MDSALTGLRPRAAMTGGVSDTRLGLSQNSVRLGGGPAQQVAVVVAQPRIGDERELAGDRPALVDLELGVAADPDRVPGGVERDHRGAHRHHDGARRAAEWIAELVAVAEDAERRHAFMP